MLSRRSNALLAATILGLTALSADAEDDSGLTASLTLTSDYVFRGISQSGQDAALQGGAYYSHRKGFSAGVWASSLESGAAAGELEIDYVVDYAYSFGEQWAASAGLSRYTYPDMSGGNADYTELLINAYYDEWLSATVGYSNDVFGEGRAGVSYQINGNFSAPRGIEVSAELGFYDLTDAYDSSYSFYSVGLSRSFGPLTVGLAYHDTGGDAQELFGARLSGSRSELYVSADF